ncbi:MAG: hypothetical protein GY906_35510 [bacterium]|nr:hypothetical protein [bacterium]
MFGLPSKHQRKYLSSGRLPDVLALIQVLALDPSTHRSELGKAEDKVRGLQGELQGPPESADTWVAVARDHPEFFRVNLDAKSKVSLVARHVTPKDPATDKRVLAPEFVGKLMELAVDLHDRQIRFAERWTYLVPIWVALIVATTTIVAKVVEYRIGG